MPISYTSLVLFLIAIILLTAVVKLGMKLLSGNSTPNSTVTEAEYFQLYSRFKAASHESVDILVEDHASGRSENVNISNGESHTTSHSMTVQLIGGVTKVTWSNGVSCDMFLDPNNASQYYYADGIKISPGQIVKLPGGHKVKQK
jgi:archaellum component FlaF (FlaF/FlaG flagellin family)